MKEKQIVVIDDSQAILMVMKTMLLELGFANVVTSSNPRKALDLIRNHPEKYSAVFTDLNMPDIDGMEVIRQLGESRFSGGVCIISDMEKRIIQLAADIARQHEVCLLGNISKPIDLNSLKRALDKLQQMEERNFVHYKKMSREELRACLDARFITPYYQPKVNIYKHKVDGVEVLARICKPGVPKAILPGQFIPTAMRYNMLDEITLQILEKALDDLPMLCKEFGNNVRVSVNLSPNQLIDPKYPDTLNDMVTTRGVEKSQIILEITEEFALKSTEQLESLNRFRIRGFGLSLDDFGTGFTNLQQLRNLPFTEVKIDRSLITDIHCDQFNQVVVNSLADISKKLNVTLIAEGMETIEDLHYLEHNYRDMHIQGFLICTPKPVDSLLRWYHSWANAEH
ncbi:putative diguanylate phosphodiesterase [Vibrio nigripulchritudo ATCC 27043]|uniref:EAL domain-containing response regulator n=1 Tax=Vibrio nigripulchritudo TaxID=28173 RepID=UPI00021C1F26|nr:EAL domain-containing response regulator [Vibrio nigripulchritudo]EGU60394.1 putative diguanylate phosphodiesterase [Vibrio nigripulchritudo ATCC 27043]